MTPSGLLCIVVNVVSSTTPPGLLKNATTPSSFRVKVKVSPKYMLTSRNWIIFHDEEIFNFWNKISGNTASNKRGHKKDIQLVWNGSTTSKRFLNQCVTSPRKFGMQKGTYEYYWLLNANVVTVSGLKLKTFWIAVKKIMATFSELLIVKLYFWETRYSSNFWW